MRTKELLYWIKERYSIRQKKAAGKPKPWTKDKILQQYRFCNVHREDDAVTVWIRQNWRQPYDHDPNLWFAMVVARLLNWPPTLHELGYTLATGRGHEGGTYNWNAKHFLKVLQARKKRGEQVFNSAYIVSTNGKAMDKLEYLVQYVLSPLWEARMDAPRASHMAGGARPSVQTLHSTHLEELYNWLTLFDGMGSFMAAQVIADVKYQAMWSAAPDWHTFAASGPGSRRGLNRVFGFDKDSPWGGEGKWYSHLLQLKAEIDPLITKAGVPQVHAQDLQNCLCEFDKWERVRLGEGKPRNAYPGVL